MKFVIDASRGDRNDSWHGSIGDKRVTACNNEVDKLFAGLTRALKAKFEISNVRPTYYDYQTFIRDLAGYQVTEITEGDRPRLTTFVSKCISDAFKNKGEKCEQIFVSVYS